MGALRSLLRRPVKADSNSEEGGILLALIDAANLELKERVVSINRVSKTVKGGRIFKFAALVVVGDGNGTVGFGLGKAGEVPDAIRKGIEDAKKNLHKVALKGTTIRMRSSALTAPGRVLMKPAPEGTGVIAAVRSAPCLRRPASRTSVQSACAPTTPAMSFPRRSRDCARCATPKRSRPFAASP